MHRRAVIVGAGSLGRELRLYLNLEGAKNVVFLDDFQQARLELPVIGKIAEASFLLNDDDVLLIACADPAGRRQISESLASYPPSSYAHRTVIGAITHGSAGLMALPYALISENAHLGRCALLNTYASIGHDCIVGDFVTLCSHSTLTGRVVVGDGAFIGTGAIVCPDVKIGHGAYIGAGSVVVKDVAPGEKVFGNPARKYA